jgi:hypothetical protein
MLHSSIILLLFGVAQSLNELKISIPKFQTQSFGLLSGFDKKQNVKDFNQKFYSDKVEAKIVRERLSDSNILWSAFMEDIDSSESVTDVLKNISHNAMMYTRPENKNICDRFVIIEYLKRIEVGDFVILTGGPSTGKSLVVNQLFANRSD